MKLNAKISSEKPSRIVSKSGDEYIKVELSLGNRHTFTVIMGTENLVIIDPLPDLDKEAILDVYPIRNKEENPE